MKRALLRLMLLAAPLGGCEAQGKPDPTHPTAPPPSASAPAPISIGTFASKRFGIRLALPGGRAWTIDDSSTRWLTATHPEGSSLLVRVWHDENRMSRDKCEEKARSVRKLPVRAGAEIVEERTLDVPPGLDTRADVGLVASPRDGGLFGFILAFGGWGRRCFAYVYVTSAKGEGADRVVADRLAAMMEGSLGTLRVVRDFDVVIERGAPPIEE